jgi:hypothetical protein
VRRWLDDVASVDGYVFVVPEYNFEVPASAKNALDLLAHEAEGKPALIQSYSDTSYGGIIAGHLFRLPLSKMGMFPMPKSLPMPHAERLFDEDGTLVEDTDWARILDRYMYANRSPVSRTAHGHRAPADSRYRTPTLAVTSVFADQAACEAISARPGRCRIGPTYSPTGHSRRSL